VHLRDVSLEDVSLYERLRCDPAMMIELGGAVPREGIPDKVSEDVASTEKDESWICVIASDEGEVMGHVCIWSHEMKDGPISEIGWMVLPEFQGRGVGRDGAAALLERARLDGRWGVIHAYPSVTNQPSNGVCRSLGFTLVATGDFDYGGTTLRCNHWQIDPKSDTSKDRTPRNA
jgi:RimJ/RimL family protein N-acetyltransferase